MAAIIGKVTNVESIVRAISPMTQEVRTLVRGESVFANELLTTTENASILIELENGEMLALGRSTQMRLDDDVYSVDSIDVGTEAAVTDIAALQQAILEGNFDDLEETAAGEYGALGAASEGGIQIARLASEGKVNAGGFSTVAHAQGITDVLTDRFDEIEDKLAKDAGNVLTLDEDTSLSIDVTSSAKGLAGTDFTILITSQPANGTVTINADGSITYKPNANFNGKDHFSYVISDGFGGTHEASVNLFVTAVDDDPIAQDDTATVDVNGTTTINVLANDSDPDGGTLTLGEVTQPANGSISINDDGTIDYTPDTDFTGTDSFTYTVVDESGVTQEATVEIVVAPESVNPDSVTLDETDSVLSTSGTLTSTDVNSTFTAATTIGTNGTFTINESGAWTFTANSEFDSLEAGQSLSETFNVTTVKGTESTVTVQINGTTDIEDSDATQNWVNENSAVGTYTGVTISPVGAAVAGITYSLPNTLPFSIEADGRIVVSAPIDYETTSSYTFNVTATSPDGSVDVQEVTIGINDESGYITGTDGTDVLDTITGSATHDYIFGTAEEEIIDGGAGNDRIYAGAGNDVINGSSGHDNVYAGEGNNTINFAQGNERIITGSGADIINSGLGTYEGVNDHDQIYSGAGNDVIDSGHGHDKVFAGSGDDIITAAGGENILDGGSGNDTITGGTWIDKIQGGEGNDTIDGGAGRNKINAGGGDDYIKYNNSTEYIDGGAGNDTLEMSIGTNFDRYVAGTVSNIETINLQEGSAQALTNMTVQGVKFVTDERNLLRIDGDNTDTTDINTTADWTLGSVITDAATGQDYQQYIAQDGSGVTLEVSTKITVNEVAPSWDYFSGISGIHGDETAETLTGTDSNNTIVARGGDDIIDSQLGNDTIFAGAGDDTVTSAGGSNYIDASDGNNTVTVGAGNDTIFAGTGNDTITAGDGTNFVSSGAGDDTITGGTGKDTIYAGAGNDTINSGANTDVIYAGAGDDVITTTSGNNSIYAGTGNDTITAGSGDDTINGGLGNDMIDAGAGNDLIVAAEGQNSINAGAGNDTIYITEGDGKANSESVIGGSGIDKVIFSGNIADYTVSYDAGTAIFTITNIATGEAQSIHDDVENIQFADTLIATSDGAFITDVATSNSESITLTETDIALTTSGTLTKVDAGDPFVANTIIGTKGTFTIDAAGDWTFTANATFDSLNVGDSVVETFNVASVGEAIATVTIQINGTNDVATVSSDSVTLTETDVALSTSGTLTSSDADNTDNAFTADTIVGTNGTFAIDAAGAWTFTANSAFDYLSAGASITETFDVTSIDGTPSTVTIQIDGTDEVNTPAVIGGVVTGSVTEDAAATLTTSGILTITDADAGEAVFTAETVAGTYGSIAIAADGGWTYSADTTQTAIQVLNTGEALTDTIAVTSADGTSQNIIITINGIDDAGAIITGTTGADILMGTAASDTIDALAGNDKVFAGAGDDIITSASGNNIIDGGAGDDTITTGTGNDWIHSGDGNDTIDAGAGINIINAGAGDDHIFYDGDDFVDGGLGNDTLEVSTASFNFNLYAGNYTTNIETVKLSDGSAQSVSNISVVAVQNMTDARNLLRIDGDNTDQVDINTTSDWTLGTLINDAGQNYQQYVAQDGSGVIIEISTNITVIESAIASTDNDGVIHGDELDNITPGSLAANDIVTRGGNDYIDSGARNDNVFAGAGDDTLITSGGTNYLDAGEGNNTVVADGTNTVFSGAGIDNITTLGGDDFISSGAGDDIIDSGARNDTVFSGAGNDTVEVGGGVNIVYAGDGDDTITSADGTNTIDAGEGNNTIITGLGDDVITAGAGNDVIDSGDRNDTINAGDGNNIIVSGGGLNTITAGTGDDSITADGTNIIDAGEGHNTITTGLGDDVINSGAGNDFISSGDRNDTINAGDGNNIIVSGGGLNTITAGTGDDSITADGTNIIDAGEGHNTITTGLGDDVINSGAGNDVISSGDRNDTINAGDGNNIIVSGGGLNTITAGAGDDSITAGGTNIIDAGEGHNTIITGDGDDIITAGAGDDVISSGVRNDTINAGDGNNIIDSGTGTDTIISGSGDDVITGSGTVTINSGAGNDTITVGAGNDTITAGAGKNTINAGGGWDTITITEGDGVEYSETVIGGDGNDTVVFAGNIADYAVTYHADTAIFTITNLTTGEPQYIHADVEKVQFADTLILTTDGAFINAVAPDSPILTMSIGDAAINSGTHTDLGAGYGNDITIVDDWNAQTFTGTDANERIEMKGDSGGSIINTAGGNDNIILADNKLVTVDAGTGDDRVEINNWLTGSIVTGEGDDRVINNSGTNSHSLSDGSVTTTTIDTGAGNDYVEMIVAERGQYSLGEGNDTIVRDFASDVNLGKFQVIDGGTGNDTLVLTGSPSEYVITDNLDGTYTVSNAADFAASNNSLDFTITNIETISYTDGSTQELAAVAAVATTYEYVISLHAEVINIGTETLSDIKINTIPTGTLLKDSSGNVISVNGDGSYTAAVDGSGNAVVTLVSSTVLSQTDLTAITSDVIATETGTVLTATTTTTAPGAVYDEIAISDETGVTNGNLLDNVDAGSTLDSIVYNGTTYNAADYAGGLTINTLSGGTLALDFTTGTYTSTGTGTDETFTVNATDSQSNSVSFTFDANDIAGVDAGILYGDDAEAEQFNIETGHDTTIVDFDYANDVLDLSEIITGPVDAATLSNYLDFTFGGTDTDGDGNMDVTAIIIDADADAGTTNDITTIYIQDGQFDMDQIDDLKVDYQDN